MTGSHMHWQVADGRHVGGEQPHRSPRGGRRILVFRVALERTRTPRYSLSSHPSYSRGALKTLHNTVLPPRGWRLQHGRHRAYPRPRRAPHGAAARHGQEREAEPTDSPADSGLPPNRLADMSANPYLMAAAIGAAGLDGLRARSVPPPPTDRKPRLPEITRDYPRLPEPLWCAGPQHVRRLRSGRRRRHQGRRPPFSPPPLITHPQPQLHYTF